MNLLLCTVQLVVVLTCSVAATDVRNCGKNGARVLEQGDVKISSCPKNKCVLKRNTEARIEMKIVPHRDFANLTSNIQGIILDVPLPFPGYYGTNACPNIYDAQGEKQVGCPLKAGENYIYKNSFKILPVYPTVSLTVYWALGDKNGDVSCFEIPARIKA